VRVEPVPAGYDALGQDGGTAWSHRESVEEETMVVDDAWSTSKFGGQTITLREDISLYNTFLLAIYSWSVTLRNSMAPWPTWCKRFHLSSS